MRKSNVKQTAVTALFAALSTVLLLLGSLSETLSLSAAAVASFPVLLLVCEYGTGWAAAAYASSALLALMLAPLKEGALEFACFFGVFPILKHFAETKRKPISLLIKGAALLLSCAAFILSSFLFFSEDISFLQTIYYYILPPVTVLAFFLYDRCLTLLLRLYKAKIRSRIIRFLR